MKPWLVVNIVDGDLSGTYQRDTEAEVTEMAVKLALEQGDKSEEQVRKELAADGNVWLQDGSIRIYVEQAEGEERNHDEAGSCLASAFSELAHRGALLEVVATAGVTFEEFEDGKVYAAVYTSGPAGEHRLVVPLPQEFQDALRAHTSLD